MTGLVELFDVTEVQFCTPEALEKYLQFNALRQRMRMTYPFV